MDDPFEDTPFDDQEDFDEWLDHGGRAQIEQSQKERKAMWRRKIRQGEVEPDKLVRRIITRLKRVFSFIDIGLPYFIVLESLELVEDALEDLRIWVEENH